MAVEPKPQSPGTDRPSEKPPQTEPQGEPPRDQPMGDPPAKKPPVIIGKPQATTEPGDHGRGSGPVHTEPLVRNSPQQEPVGPGSYGNDQFAAEHHDDFVDDPELPEGLQDPQGGAVRPTLRSKEKRYGRVGEDGKG